MGREELDLLLGGPQGAGLETTMHILASAFAHLGYGVIADREYFSNIKGRHSYIHSRVAATSIPCAITYPVQVVAAMDPETIFTHFEDIAEGGYLVYDTAVKRARFDTIQSMDAALKERLQAKFDELGLDGTVGAVIEYVETRGIKPVEINYRAATDQVRERFGVPASQAARYVSSILVGAVAGLVGLDDEGVKFGINRRFRGRPKLVEPNLLVADYVVRTVQEAYGTPLKLDPPKLNNGEFVVANGNDVVAMAKIVAGLRFQSYYPINPASDESFTMEGYENLEVNGESVGNIMVLQTEDEMAAIASAIGAALTGVRSSTATSGPGFSLMTEGLGWAGMNEVPLVITYYQRGGPSTGLPTRGSQSDLMFALFAAHGEFPKIVIASGDHEEAFYDTIYAFNLAERYQTPVIHLLDKFLANTVLTMALPELSHLKLERAARPKSGEGYKRFDLSAPISPMAPLGFDGINWYTGNEHDEHGNVSEDPVNRQQMYKKRMDKMELADREIPMEARVAYFGPEDPDFLVVGWGSTKGVVLDALRELQGNGLKGAYLHLKMFSPFPTDYVKRMLTRLPPERVVAVEHSYVVQASQVIALNTGVKVERAIIKYTGRPIYINELVQALDQVLTGQAKEVVLTYGA
jgi:2-oxoglutarate ferredoxin oxidoreductase subunit alpha